MDIVLHYKKVDGKIKPIEGEGQLRFSVLSRFKEGETIDAIFKKHRKSRSNQQNRYLWGVVYEMIAKEIGEHPEKVHELMKYKFLRETKEVNGEEMIYLESTADLSTDDFGQYIDKIKDWALHFLNITIPEPNQVDLETIKER